ncbi:MAG: hypothetical protein JO013_05585 [Alphaproteobacteria bacterium]|nr:hypothetical protein [Alphaproteobacteria bacterium]
MIEGDALALPEAALAEAKALLRAGDAGEDEAIAAMLASAADLCERFTGQVLIARAFRETLAAAPAETRRSHGWRRLARTPVRAIVAVERLAADGAATPVPAGEHAIDIDANGDGWIRADPRPGPVRVSFEAGLASDWAGVPASLAQGVLRLAAHFYTYRTDAGAQAEPPAAVAALWRPWRRLRIA